MNEQFIEIYQKLEEMSTNLTRVVLIYNILMSTYQIDLLIITTKGIAIIKLNDYLGNVHGSTERDESGKFPDWDIVTTNGTVDAIITLYVNSEDSVIIS